MPTNLPLDRRRFLKAAGFLGTLYGTSETAIASQAGNQNELLVGIAPSANTRQTAERALPNEARIVSENNTLGYVRAELPERASATARSQVANTVAAQSGVEYVEPNTTYEALAVPNDSRFPDQYAPEMVNALGAWDLTFGDDNVTIAILDQGVKYDHPDLSGAVASNLGQDLVNGDDDPYPPVPSDESHGTHVAGIAAARTDNSTGISGISDSTLLSVRVLDESESGLTSDIADGIQWAADQGVDIINLSLGGGYSKTLQSAVVYAHEKGMLLVAAAGNDFGSSVIYPGAYEECMAVSALDPDGSIAPYSNIGSEVDVTAPGTNVLSTWTNDGYESYSGTSMAAPIVSGVAALVLSQQDLTNVELRKRLEDTAVDVGLPEDEQGNGRIDAAAAVGSPLENTLTVEATGSYSSYEFSVSGEVGPRQGIAGKDRISGNTASGAVGGTGRDSYGFSGVLTDITVDGTADVFLNGQPVDTSLEHTLVVEATGSYSSYEFSASGEVGPRQGIAGKDSISGNTASGAVGGDGLDSYGFSGELRDLSVDGDANVYLDGQEIDADFDHTLSIQASGSYSSYEFSVSGKLGPQEGIGGIDQISGNTASGAVGGTGRDSYGFSGVLTDMTVDGTADVFLNGQPVDTSLEHTLVIEATNSYSSYEFSASGEVGPRQGIAGKDSISGNTASGAVGGDGLDSYGFSGELRDLSVDGDANVYLDGEEIASTQSILTITSEDERFSYQFSVSGNLEKSTAMGATIDDNDSISESTAVGQGKGGLDSYSFSGEITEFRLNGDATLYLDGSEIDITEILPDILTVEASGSYSSYEFTTTGGLGPQEGIAGKDHIDIESGRATGAVSGSGRDSYAFSGAISDIDVNGTAKIYINGELIDTNPPSIGVYSGLSDADFETIDHMEEWQNVPYAVQNIFVPWNPDEGHMNWLFDRILPQIWDAGRIPLITWEPYTPSDQTASVDTAALVRRNEYFSYIESLADSTPDDIEVRIANGEYDQYIDRWANRLQDSLAVSNDRQAYLRFAHEMNSDWYPWSPTVGNTSSDSYIGMWQHVHDRFGRLNAHRNVEWMWCVNAEDVGSYTAEEMYPGNGYVDWLGLDGYNWGQSQTWSNWNSADNIYGDMLNRLRRVADKPVCVAEFASSSMTDSGYDPEQKDEWIDNTLTYFEQRNVDMWCWFNEDKETDWAVFDGARGTETETGDGFTSNAYTNYRETISPYAINRNGSATETSAVNPPLTND